MTGGRCIGLGTWGVGVGSLLVTGVEVNGWVAGIAQAVLFLWRYMSSFGSDPRSFHT